MPGVTQYALTRKVGTLTVTTLTSAPQLLGVTIGNGAVEWFVEAITPNCPTLTSTKGGFTVVPPPPACSTPQTTDVRAGANASSDVEYTVRWNPIPNVSGYEFEESFRPCSEARRR